MKKDYMEPEFDITKFEFASILAGDPVTASAEGAIGDGDGDGDNWDWDV